MESYNYDAVAAGVSGGELDPQWFHSEMEGME